MTAHRHESVVWCNNVLSMLNGKESIEAIVRL